MNLEEALLEIENLKKELKAQEDTITSLKGDKTRMLKTIESQQKDLKELRDIIKTSDEQPKGKSTRLDFSTLRK